jgi:hypothetical protein
MALNFAQMLAFGAPADERKIQSYSCEILNP